MKAEHEGRLQIQNKGVGTTDDIRTTNERGCASEMYQNYRHATENNMERRLPHHTGEIRMMKMRDTVLTVGIVILMVFGFTAGIAMAVPEKTCPVGEIRPLKYMGWTTDENALIPRIPCGYENRVI
jgi:hypothetical protein